MARSYAVQLRQGRLRLTAPFPFGRLQIAADGIRLYARLIPWIRRYEWARPDINRVVLTRTFGGAVTIRIEDSAGLASRVWAVFQLPSGKIRRELIAYGYPVVAYDRWLSFRNPWQKRGWSAPPRVADWGDGAGDG
jgi:hypothetical protein